MKGAASLIGKTLLGKRGARTAGLAGLAILMAGADPQPALAQYALVRLKESPSYAAAYGQVNKQLTVLELKRNGRTKGAKCRSEAAIDWLAEQKQETASWSVPGQEQKTDALRGKLVDELVAQRRLQPCKRSRLRRNP